MDHIIAGLSFVVGYSYNEQENSTWHPKDTDLFDSKIVNSDPILQGFSMHVLHLLLEYDFSFHMTDYKWAPRVSAFYNLPLEGENAFKTDTFGGGFGVDIRWEF